MATVINYIRSEPVAFGTILSIIATLVVTLTHNDVTVGLIAAAVQAVVGVVIRSQVAPTASPPKA